MRRDEWVHESLEIGTPPLRERVANLPLIVDAFAGELRAYGRKAFVQPRFEALDLLDIGSQIVSGPTSVSSISGEMSIIYAQFEECIRNLQHEDVRVVVLVADQDALACPSHTTCLVVFLQSLQSRKDRGILFGLGIFGAESVVA